MIIYIPAGRQVDLKKVSTFNPICSRSYPLFSTLFYITLV